MLLNHSCNVNAVVALMIATACSRIVLQGTGELAFSTSHLESCLPERGKGHPIATMGFGRAQATSYHSVSAGADTLSFKRLRDN